MQQSLHTFLKILPLVVFASCQGTMQALPDVDVDAGPVSQSSESPDVGSANLRATSGELVTLNASNFLGLQGATYQWAQLSGPAITLGDPTAAEQSFLAPSVPEVDFIILGLDAVASEISTKTVITITIIPAGSAPPPPSCEDGTQNGDETGVDCGGSCPPCPPVEICGDNVCNADETCSSCEWDCGACPPPPASIACGTLADACHNDPLGDSNYCDESCPCGWGEGDCDNDEQCQGELVCVKNIGADFGRREGEDICVLPDYPNNQECAANEPPMPSSCGDGTCDSGEDCNTCESDCGVCPPDPDPTLTCGDGTCDPDESCGSCSVDCGTCPPAVSTASIYVAPNGSDSNPGTESSPLRTVARAAEVASAGDVVLVRSGNYEGDFSIETSGSSASPIRFVGEAGARLITDRSQDDASVWIRADHVIFENLDVEGNIHIRGHHNIVASNYVHDSYEKGGIHLAASDRNASDCTHNTVRDNEIARTVGTGIYIEGQNHQVLNNEIYRIVDHAPDGSNQTDADGIRFFGSHHLVKGNYVHDIWQTDMMGLPHVDMLQTWEEAHHIVFDGNVLHNPNPIGSNRILMLERKDGAGPVGNITWVNNIFIFSDDSSAFMNFNRKDGQPEIADMVMVNNVFYSPGGLVEKAASLNNITRVTFRNNLVVNTGKNGNEYIAVKSGTSGTDIGNNAIYNTDGSMPDQTSYPGDLWGVDPGVVDLHGNKIEELDFHLTSSSPLIDAGWNHSFTAWDHDEAPRPQGSGFDIGAYERP